MESIISQELLKSAAVSTQELESHNLSSFCCSQHFRDCVKGRSRGFQPWALDAMANRAELHFPSLTVGVSVSHNVQHHENTQCAKLLVWEKKSIIILHKLVKHYLNVAIPYRSPDCNRITGEQVQSSHDSSEMVILMVGQKNPNS